MTCVFCDPPENIKTLVFYQDKNWFAFLATPFHTQGHTIVAARKKRPACPEGLEKEILTGLDSAIAKVSRTLMIYYEAKDILIASLRGDIKHCHWHLLPLHENEEKEWRTNNLYERGHLLEYLGFLEKRGEEKAALERIKRGWAITEQRLQIAIELKTHAKELQKRSKA